MLSRRGLENVFGEIMSVVIVGNLDLFRVQIYRSIQEESAKLPGYIHEVILNKNSLNWVKFRKSMESW
jgi:hypothetical protein